MRPGFYDKNNHPTSKRFTPDEVKDICQNIMSMNRKKAIEYGKSINLTHVNIDNLRSILGLTDISYNYKFSNDEKDKIVSLYKSGTMGVQKIATMYGVNFNTIYCLLKTRDVELRKGNWDKRKTLALLDMKKKGYSNKEIARYFGKSPGAICDKLHRIRLKKEQSERWQKRWKDLKEILEKKYNENNDERILSVIEHLNSHVKKIDRICVVQELKRKES